MKAILVRPAASTFKRLNAVPPLGLGYLSAALKKAGFETKIIDCIVRQCSLRQLLETIKMDSPDVVGFHVYSQDVGVVSKCIKAIKEQNPSIITIVGGPHPSGVCQEIFSDFPSVDFAFQAEAEIGLVSLLNIIKKKGRFEATNSDDISHVGGLIYQKDGNVYVNRPLFVENLDELDFPDWGPIDPRLYPHAPQGLIFRSLPFAPIIATRGCPFPCSFCAGSTISGKPIRKRSIENIISEINLLIARFGIREIHILDDNFTFDRDYIRDFCSALLKENIKINWCCPNGIRLDTLTEDIVKLMKESGCYYISVGIESGTERILEDMHKNITTGQIRRQVAMIKNAGMDVNGFFILGYPGETASDIRRTIDFALKMPLTRAAFYNFIPLPNTEIYRRLTQKRAIKNINWNNFFQGDVPYAPDEISKKELKGLQRIAFRRFYLRPSIFLGLISRIKSLSQLFYIIKRAFVYI